MKIAFVGKGGSGKSSISWLASEVLRADGSHVLFVDADHNMDTAHMYGAHIDDSFPTLHRAHDRFREFVGQKEDKRWHEIVLDDRPLPSFSLNPKDTFTDSVTWPMSPSLDLMVVGLGAEDVLFTSRCAHGHSAPLKYYLPLLRLGKEEACVVDGVAGVDMMHFGLYSGVDMIVVVVEPYPNSVRVFKEVKRIAQETGIPLVAIANKTDNKTTLPNLDTSEQALVIGAIPIDEGMRIYDFGSVREATKLAMREAIAWIRDRLDRTSGLARLREFEARRQGTVHT